MYKIFVKTPTGHTVTVDAKYADHRHPQVEYSGIPVEEQCVRCNCESLLDHFPAVTDYHNNYNFEL